MASCQKGIQFISINPLYALFYLTYVREANTVCTYTVTWKSWYSSRVPRDVDGYRAGLPEPRRVLRMAFLIAITRGHLVEQLGAIWAPPTHPWSVCIATLIRIHTLIFYLSSIWSKYSRYVLPSRIPFSLPLGFYYFMYISYSQRTCGYRRDWTSLAEHRSISSTDHSCNRPSTPVWLNTLLFPFFFFNLSTKKFCLLASPSDERL